LSHHHNSQLLTTAGGGSKWLRVLRLKLVQLLDAFNCCLDGFNLYAVNAGPVLKPYARITQFMQSIGAGIAYCAQPA
jgi:hypothetical protein